MVAACAVFDYALFHLLLFVLYTYCDVWQLPVKSAVTGTIHASKQVRIFPRHLVNNETMVLRSVITGSDWSEPDIKDMSIQMSLRHLPPGETMTCQFFGKSYPLPEWKYQKRISEKDQKYLLYVVTVDRGAQEGHVYNARLIFPAEE